MGRRRRCVGINKNGERCRVRALQGEYYCRRHLENMDDYPTCTNLPDYLYSKKEKDEYRYLTSTYNKKLDISNNNIISSDYKNQLPVFRENNETYNSFLVKSERIFFGKFIKLLFIVFNIIMFFQWVISSSSFIPWLIGDLILGILMFLTRPKY